MVSLPTRFDQNEWFVLITLVTVTLVVLFLPRRFPTIVSIVFLSIGLGTGMWVDYQLSQPPFDLYYVDDTKQYGLFDLLYYLLYAPFAYIFAYFYDKWNIKGAGSVLYVMCWSMAGVGIEALAVYCRGFTYTGWKLHYSAVVYLAVQSCYVWLFHLVKNTYKRTRSNSGQEWI